MAFLLVARSPALVRVVFLTRILLSNSSEDNLSAVEYDTDPPLDAVRALRVDEFLGGEWLTVLHELPVMDDIVPA